MSSSPAQRLMSRRTRSMLPCKTQYYPLVQAGVPQKIICKKQKAKKYYDRAARHLPELVVGQPVSVKTQPSGVVESQVAPRSYTVKAGERRLRRNRVHLYDIPAGVRSRVLDISDVADNVAGADVVETVCVPPREKIAMPLVVESTDTGLPAIAETEVIKTRSGCVVKPPQKY